MTSHATLGLLLVRDGLIDRPQLYDALRYQRQHGRLLGTCLLELGWVSRDGLLRNLSRQLHIPMLPEGALDHAAPEAIAQVPAEVAWRLRVVPTSWDGTMLAVALFDAGVLPQLPELADRLDAAIGAYLALECEIEEALKRFYPQGSGCMNGHPAKARDAGAGASKEACPAAEVCSGAGAPSKVDFPILQPLRKRGLYEAIEAMYEATDVPAVVAQVGAALLDHFRRVAVLNQVQTDMVVAAWGGVKPSQSRISLAALPQVLAGWGRRSLAYGRAEDDPRAPELAGALGWTPPRTALIAPVNTEAQLGIVFYADNASDPELYEDLHDIEMLFKEAETALAMLLRG